MPSSRRVCLPLLAYLFVPLFLHAQVQNCDEGAYHIARGDYARALSSLSAVPVEKQSDASQLNMRGVAEMLSGNAADAIKTFDAAIERDPKLEEARFNKGIALLKLERYPAAAAEFKTIFEDTGSALRGTAAYHRAIALDRSGDTPLAIRSIQKALELDSTLDAAHLYLGVLLERRGDFQGAGEHYREYIGRKPESLIAFLRFGIVAQRAGYLETAQRYLREVVQRGPGTLEAAEAQKFLVMWE